MTHLDEHDDHGGLHRDIPKLITRRQAVMWAGGLSLAGILAACGSDSEGASTASGSSTGVATPGSVAADSTASAGPEIPDETQGPFPADGSNGPNLLGTDGINRSDITSSIGGLSGTAEGVPMRLQLTVVNASDGSPLAGAAVYLWHCTADGRYSIYEISDQNYLRGVQAADDAGRIVFDTILPGCYPGRWPHCHFEVYGGLDAATSGQQATKTSQIALPQADCEAVYADARYGGSLSNLGRLSLASDGVFADGWQDQLATLSGSPDSGYTASLLVRV